MSGELNLLYTWLKCKKQFYVNNTNYFNFLTMQIEACKGSS